MQTTSGESRKLTVLACYDQEEDSFVQDIDDSGWDCIDTTPFTGKGLAEALKQLNALKNETIGGDAPGEIKTEFDDYDIVMVDNNLTALEEFDGVINTAEPIIGFIRTFASSPYIISVNGKRDVDFDLEFLVGDRSSTADLVLHPSHLTNSALWTHAAGDATGGFLPWYWPQLSTVACRRREQVDLVLKHFDQPVLDVLEFDDEARSALSMRALGLLTHNIDHEPRQPAEATFRDVFLTAGRALANMEERRSILRLADEKGEFFLRAAARVAAAAVDLWLRADVLAAQNVLVDIPHLLNIMPHLLGKYVDDVNRWNGDPVAVDSIPPHGLDPIRFGVLLASAEFAPACWLPSPCFWWTKLESVEELNEIFADHTPNVPDVVFCEDQSIFVVSAEGANVRPFSADLDGAWNQRYVSRLADISYDPASRLAS